jgi:hypothetical protein
MFLFSRILFLLDTIVSVSLLISMWSEYKAKEPHTVWFYLWVTAKVVSLALFGISNSILF